MDQTRGTAAVSAHNTGVATASASIALRYAMEIMTVLTVGMSEIAAVAAPSLGARTASALIVPRFVTA